MTDEVVRPRRRWLWGCGVLVVLAVSALPVSYLFVRWQGDRELAAVRAELDASDPDWRMPDLCAARNTRLQALKLNSANTAAAGVKLLPDGWDQQLVEVRWLSDGPPNRQPPAKELEALRTVHKLSAPARDAARDLRDQTEGGSPLSLPDYSTYAFNLNLTPVQERRRLMTAFQLHACLSALDGDGVAALDAARAGLNLSRSIGDEPLLISQLVRLACCQVSVRAAERSLGLSEPTDGLAELQSAFEREAGERFMRDGIRGERASADQIMTNIRAGTVSGAAAGATSAMALNPFWPHDHAATLRLMNAFVEDDGRLANARGASARAEQELMADSRAVMSRLLAPATGKCLEADTRNRATVAVAAVGIACERHRRATGLWPATLAELPKGLLAAVPADPYDGQPLRYKRTADGAVVYSVGQNLSDDGGTPPSAGDSKVGDVVFRLFDPDKRRLPALPPAPADNP